MSSKDILRKPVLDPQINGTELGDTSASLNSSYMPRKPGVLLMLVVSVAIAISIIMPFRESRWMVTGFSPEPQLESSSLNNFCDNIPYCIRLLSGWDQLFIYKAMRFTADSLNVSRVVGHLANIEKRYAVMTRAAELMFRFFWFGIPVLLAAMYFLRTGFSQILFPTLCALALIYWGGLAPHFGGMGPIGFYDYTGFGGLLLFVIYLARTRRPRLLTCIVFAVWAQLHFNHLGLLFACAASGFYWFTNFQAQGWRGVVAWTGKGMTIAVSCVAAMHLTKLYVGMHIPNPENLATWPHIQNVLGLYYEMNKRNFADDYILYGQLPNYFILNYKWTVFAGILIGLASMVIFCVYGKKNESYVIKLRRDFTVSVRCLLACGAVMLAYALSMIPAVFMSGLSLEIGRQSTHIALLLSLFSIKLTEALVQFLLLLDVKVRSVTGLPQHSLSVTRRTERVAHA